MQHRITIVLFFVTLNVSVCLAQKVSQILIETQRVAWVFSIHDNGRLYQSYLGERLSEKSEYQLLNTNCSGWSCREEAYIPSGMNDMFEPAIRMVHTDGNPSLELLYKSHTTQQPDENTTLTDITLYDPKYPVVVHLIITSWYKEDVFSSRVEIRHTEKSPVMLTEFASSLLHFNANAYYLTQFHGTHGAEMKIAEYPLTSGIKVLESKLGARVSMFQMPFFLLSLNRQSDENTGEVIAGALAWSGNFRFLFEIDELNRLRVISGMNPSASEYHLPAKETFETPAFIFTFSKNGRGNASRNLHQWAANYGVLDGKSPRKTLLNNWEATYFGFNQDKLDELIRQAAGLGIDVFLLDDGWFGQKYPRNNDDAGLGDWVVNREKLPGGIGHLIQEAKKNNIQLGIWVEPEMVNPKSELYEKHPDWVIKLPQREEHLYRNQLMLDLTNPQVQDYVYEVMDRLFTENPGLAYVKWDCNRMMTNEYAPYLKDKQSHIYIEYVRGLYKVWERIRAKYPHIPMMLCSGGAGRVDYGALKYFTELWPSDNTDGLERVYMQWGYSYFYPAAVISAHVTGWGAGTQSLKFRTDVAMSGKFGFDLDVSHLSEKDRIFAQQAIQSYSRLLPLIQQGDLYRLISPYEEKRSVITYVNDDRSQAILFSYTLNTLYDDSFTAVRLQGLDSAKQYRIKEINLPEGQVSGLAINGQTYSGDFLMKVGIPVSSTRPLHSNVLLIVN
jgi:alpha-galactosidase